MGVDPVGNWSTGSWFGGSWFRESWSRGPNMFMSPVDRREVYWMVGGCVWVKHPYIKKCIRWHIPEPSCTDIYADSIISVCRARCHTLPTKWLEWRQFLFLTQVLLDCGGGVRVSGHQCHRTKPPPGNFLRGREYPKGKLSPQSEFPRKISPPLATVKILPPQTEMITA